MKILLIIFALLTAISGYVGYVEKQETTTLTINPVANVTDTVEKNDEAQPKEEPKIVYTSVDNFVSSTITVTLAVEDASFPFEVAPESTAYDLMKEAERSGFVRFTTRDYGGDLGHLVEEINGVKNSTRENKYWIYYINGQKATIGISTYKPRTGDTISWKYEDETL